MIVLETVKYNEYDELLTETDVVKVVVNFIDTHKKAIDKGNYEITNEDTAVNRTLKCIHWY